MAELKLAKVGGILTLSPAGNPLHKERYKVLIAFDFNVVATEIVTNLRKEGELKTDPMPLIVEHLLKCGYMEPASVN
jgi:hypothetical protein